MDNAATPNRLIEQIDELLDYLHATTSVLEEQEHVLREETRRGRLEELKRRAQTARATLGNVWHQIGDKAEDWGDHVRSLWQEAKRLGSEPWRQSSQPRKKQDDWSVSFSSREWHEFFKKHPYMDPEQWKTYFQGSMIDPWEWRRVIEDSMLDRSKPLLLPGESQWHLKEPLVRTIGSGWDRLYEKVTPSTVQSPVTCLYTALFGLYLFKLLRRVHSYRNSSGVWLGEGSTELWMQAPSAIAAASVQTEPSLKDRVEQNPKHKDILFLQRSLHALRTFTAVVPFTMIVLYFCEANTLNTRLLHALGVLTLGSVIAFNEHIVINTAGLGPSKAILAPIIQYTPLITSFALFAHSWLRWI